MKGEYQIIDPVILDRNYKEIRDSGTTRGERFWNTDNIFYFIERQDWDTFNREPECKFHQIKFKKVNHTTYFDKFRDTYYKSAENFY